MTPRRSKQFEIGLGATLFMIILSFVVPSIFDGIDRRFLNLEYKIRGESTIDSSIVILYLGADDIQSLGGLPLKRNYYALAVDVLRELKAKVIGIDIAFTEPDVHGWEYDHLFANAMKRSGNVILSGYFRSISSDSGYQTLFTDTSLPDRFTTSINGQFKKTFGNQLAIPIPPLLESAAGFGHTNLSNELDIPLVVGIETGRKVLAFPYVVLLTSIFGGNGIASGEKNFSLVDESTNGSLSINYKGGISSLNMYPLLGFLQLYDMWKAGKAPPISVEKFQGKIVLLGIIAEGRSEFIENPFTSQFPSIGIHAMFLDNALHHDFLKKSSSSLRYVLIILIGLFSTSLLSMKREDVGIGSVVGFMLLCLILSFYMFSTFAYVLPIGALVLTAVTVIIAISGYRHVLIKSHVDMLTREKERITQLLHEKEIKIQDLEQELAISEQKKRDNRREAISVEIQKNKDEVARLQSLSEDFTPSKLSEEMEGGERGEFSGIIYNTKGPLAEIILLIKKIADTDGSVLVLGESGTGKELVARALHEHSKRKSKPLIVINCGALTETLLESELFGHEKGAFTGAVKEKAGRFELADGGTIFLDEIGETSEAFQVKLLRVLQDGTFERVGSTKTLKVDVRVIAATNKDILRAVEENKFRKDLFYRLNVFSIQLPTLRERTIDIPMLVEYFMTLEDPQMKCSVSVMDVLNQYSWKGNIRELSSVVKRIVLMAKADGRTLVRLKDIPEEIISEQSQFIDLEEKILMLLREKKFLRNAISETADDLGGLNRGTVAEYFRGSCFKTFVDAKWDFDAAVKLIAETSDVYVNKKVEKKLREYLSNAIEFTNQADTFDQVKILSKPKYKNLPQRYHRYLDEIIASAYRKEWMV